MPFLGSYKTFNYMKEIIVKNCNNCPFSGWSVNSTRRLTHTCSLQNIDGVSKQWKKDTSKGYDCFTSCPLKEKGHAVSLRGGFMVI